MDISLGVSRIEYLDFVITHQLIIYPIGIQNLKDAKLEGEFVDTILAKTADSRISRQHHCNI
jgi:hypothetical protein